MVKDTIDLDASLKETAQALMEALEKNPKYMLYQSFYGSLAIY